MSKKIVGKEAVDYNSRKTGKRVTGVTLHVVGASSRVEGLECEKIYVSALSPMYSQCLDFPLESEVAVSYNRYGSVESVSLVKK